MAFDNSYTAVTGATYQASDYNTSTKGNFTAIWVGTTAGDLDYYTSATAKSRLALVTGGVLYGGASAPAWLAIGASHTFLRSNGSSPEYSPLVYRRQGGSSTVWSSAGTTTYTPTKAIFQVGSQNITVTSGAGTQAITYPVAFSERPAIFLSVNANSAAMSYSWGLSWTDDTTSGFTAHIKFSGSFSGTAPISWVAIGG